MQESPTKTHIQSHLREGRGDGEAKEIGGFDIWEAKTKSKEKELG